MMLRRAQFLFVVLLLVFVAGCSALNPMAGKPAPQSVNDSLAYAQGSVTAAYRTVEQALKAGSITVDEAEAAMQEIDKADSALDDARDLLSLGKVASAEDKVNAAQSALTALQARLKQEMDDGG